jgi:hypothetical protein
VVQSDGSKRALLALSVLLSAALSIVVNLATDGDAPWLWALLGLMVIVSMALAVWDGASRGPAAGAREAAAAELVRVQTHLLRSELRRQSLWDPYPMPI